MEPPLFGTNQKSPDELLAEQLDVRESAIQKLIKLGLTEAEARSLTSLDLTQSF